MASTLRESIIGHLQLISVSFSQRIYEAQVPIADVPAELVCVWFDELYLPESSLFHSSFSDPEREALSDFHNFFESRLESLPQGGVTMLSKAPAWNEVQEKARSTLAACGWEANAD